MNATTSPEYRKLALDSSNEMMDHDAERALGRYPLAAWHMLQTGKLRVQMGQMMFDEGRFVQAAADWLSAAACFDLVPDLERMREAFERVRKLKQEGKIPPERRGIHAAFKEREEQIEMLERKLAQFQEEYDRVSDQNALDWLLAQVRELPGFPPLHLAITQVATRLGQQSRASEHLAWAEKFTPLSRQIEVARVPPLTTATELRPVTTEDRHSG